MKVLVTGGAGFIGSHLVELLVRQGYDVRVVDDLSTGSLENLSSVMDRIEFIKASITDLSTIHSALQDINIVFHLAAKINVAESYRLPNIYWKVNVAATRLLVESMIKMKVRKIIFMSSAAVYGDPVSIPISEDHPLNPINPYGRTKLEGEKIIKKYAGKGKIEAVIIRLFNAYGPRQEKNPYAGVIQKFIERVSKRQPPVIFGDGMQTRDFIYVKDVVEALLFVMEKTRGNRVLNLGTGIETRILDLAHLITNLYGYTDLKPVFKEARKGDIRRSVADINSLRRLGWTPKYTLRDGLLETLTTQENLH